MNERLAKELAEAHWKWLESLLHKVYVEAMEHGYKHGWADRVSDEVEAFRLTAFSEEVKK